MLSVPHLWPLARRTLPLLALLASACQPKPSSPALDDWAECADCGRDAYDRVVALGTPVVPTLSAWLLNGPPADRLALVRASSERVVSGATGSLSTQQAIVVNKQLADYTRQYRRRAALALGGIGGTAARTALCRARLSAPTPLEG